MRKTMSLVMTLVLFVFANYSQSTFATVPETPAFEVSSAVSVAGDKAEVNISMKNNPGVASVKVTVYYDSSLVLSSVTYGETLGGVYQLPDSLSSPVILNWATLSPVEGDMLFATLRFAVRSNASFGDKSLVLTYDPEDIFDINEENIYFDVENGKITVVDCLHKNTEIRNSRAATCAQKGYTGDTYCLNCGRLIAEGQDVYALGDANADGIVDVKDLVRLCRYLADNTVEISEYADISGDGLIMFNDMACTRLTILESEYE